MLIISTIVLMIAGPLSHSADAFQCHGRFRCLGRHHIGTSLFAVGHDEDTRSSPTAQFKAGARTRSGISTNTQIDIASVWANSLEHKIPWHAGSRRYLSESHSVLPSLGDDENDVGEQHDATAATP